MDAAEFKKLQESMAAQEANNKILLERAIRSDARELATATLKPLALQEASKARVIDLVMAKPLPMKDGALDVTAFTEAVNNEAKAEGAYVANLLESGRVRGMGSSAPAPTADEEKALREASTRQHRRALDVFSEFGLPDGAAKKIADGFGEAA